MPKHKSSLPRIGFVGDAWLKRIADVLMKLYALDGSVYIANTADKDAINHGVVGCDVIVRTWTDGAIEHQDLLCPKLYIDGLCTLEMSGTGGNRRFLGSEPLLAKMDEMPKMKITAAALKGEFEFACVDRFDASIAALENQEKSALPISDFLKTKYQSQPIVTGCKKPAPVVTLEMAKRIAAQLSLNPHAFNQVDHLFMGELALKASRRCTLPYDAQKLGLIYDPDPFWFPSFVWIFKDIVSDYNKKPI